MRIMNGLYSNSASINNPEENKASVSNVKVIKQYISEKDIILSKLELKTDFASASNFVINAVSDQIPRSGGFVNEADK